MTCNALFVQVGVGSTSWFTCVIIVVLLFRLVGAARGRSASM